MGRQIKEKQCWKKVGIQVNNDVVTVMERKQWVSLFAGFMLIWPVAFFFVVYFGAFGKPVYEDLIVVACVMAVPLVATLAIYRPPRVIRFYPKEQVVQHTSKLFNTHLFPRWTDLRLGPPIIDQVRVLSKDARSDGGTAAMGCVLMLFGPLGFLLALGLGNSGRKDRIRAYALKKSTDTSRIIAVFLNLSDAKKIVNYYELVSTDGPSDLSSGA